MSAYIVEDKTINRIITFLDLDNQGAFTKKRVKAELNGGGNGTLGQLMFALNVQAVEERYGEGQAERFRPLDYKHQYELTNRMQAFKSLRCWLYQCMEGGVPETPLYKIMEDYQNSLASRIIADMKEYDQAQWG